MSDSDRYNRLSQWKQHVRTFSTGMQSSIGRQFWWSLYGAMVSRCGTFDCDTMTTRHFKEVKE